ncbi:MAG: alkaline phosphatase family protein [Candidatus Baltobacteraceae bacterium]
MGPHASNVTVVIMENRDYKLVVGNAQAPFLNKTLIPQGALLLNSHAVTHPSQPNYLALFSGSTQGISDDSCPHTFSTKNLGSELIAAGKTFTGYSESMPSNGYTGCATTLYARKHAPWVNFTNIPASDNVVYHGFPAVPPSFAWITPNLCHDMHDCSTKTGDNWLKANLPPIIAWNATHNGLLILTWDEADPDNNGSNRIATVFVGPMVTAHVSQNERINHYNVTHTIETIFGLACIAKDCGAGDVTGIWH